MANPTIAAVAIIEPMAIATTSNDVYVASIIKRVLV